MHRGVGCWVGRVCGVLSFMVNFWCSGLVVDGWEVDFFFLIMKICCQQRARRSHAVQTG